MKRTATFVISAVVGLLIGIVGYTIINQDKPEDDVTCYYVMYKRGQQMNSVALGSSLLGGDKRVIERIEGMGEFFFAAAEEFDDRIREHVESGRITYEQLVLLKLAANAAATDIIANSEKNNTTEDCMEKLK